MARVVFRKSEQREFIEKVKKVTSSDWEELGKLVGRSGRSLRDWRREKLLGSQKVLLKLSKFSKVSLPEILEERPEYWSVHKAARKGAIARYKKYGNPGTLEGRRKGGRNSARALRGEIAYPEKSEDLAEFIGIMLGDGGITRKQISITLHREDDSEYLQFVFDLIKKLFKIEPGVYKRKDGKDIRLQVSRMSLVDFLIKLGLKKGNKVKQSVTIPEWIMTNDKFSKSVARGLMDTDGCVFDEKHRYKDKVYSYKALTFTNYSYPLMKQYIRILQNLKIKTIINSEKRVSIRTTDRIKRYMNLIGTNNPKHARKLSDFGGVSRIGIGASC